MKTKDRLATVLDEHGLAEMAERARGGGYDDFESRSETPILDLVDDLQIVEQPELARRAMEGEWNATPDGGKSVYPK